MARPNSRVTLGEYAMRALGAPVLQINIDEDQLEDRIDEALQVYQEYHSDAVERNFFKHQVTQDDIDNRYISVPDEMLYVVNVLPIGGGGDARDMFSVRYQMHMSDFFGLRSGNLDLLSYELMRQNMRQVEMSLGGLGQQVTFARHKNQLRIEIDWALYLNVGDWIVVEGYYLVDPETYTDVYNDLFLKKYLVQLVKRQWGQNLIKFQGVQLPGGVTMDGQKMYDDAQQALEKIEEEMQLRYEMPPDFFVG